jgi:FOG: EAL domain
LVFFLLFLLFFIIFFFSIYRKKDYLFLKRAIKKNKIKVFIQPIVNLHDNSIAGGEVLLRWFDSKKISIPPEHFIRIAENNNLLFDLTEISFLKIANEVLMHKEKINTKIFVSFNINASQIKENRLINICGDFIKKVNSPMIKITLELTEHDFIVIDDNVKRNLNILKGMGVNIALDDFGSKNSNLNYLLEFIPSYIKIDKAFIRSINNNDIAKYIVEELVVLSTKLSIKTIAEGVECEEELTELKHINIDYIQGHLFGKAIHYKNFFDVLYSDKDTIKRESPRI